MKKFRVKNKNGKILGPFLAGQVSEFIAQAKITKADEVQVYPDGEWELLGESKAFKSEEKKFLDSTFMKKITSDETVVETKQENNFPNEYDYKEDNAPLDPPAVPEASSTQAISGSAENETNIDKTKVINIGKASKKKLDKTSINKEALKEFNNLKKKEDDLKKEERRREKQVIIDEEQKRILKDSETEFIDMREVRYQLRNEVDNAEKEFKKESREKKAKKRKRNAKKPKNKGKDKAKIIKIAIGALLLIFMLMPSDDDKVSEDGFYQPRLLFPVQDEFMNESGAESLLKEGISLYKKDSFPSMIKAGQKLTKSMEKKFKKNPANGYLVYVYADLLEHMQNRKDEEVTLYKLIKATEIQSMKNPVFIAGSAKFYNLINKESAGIKIIEDFLALNLSNPSIDLFAEYLYLLVENGDFIKAQKVFKRLSTAKSKSVKTFASMINYNLVNQDTEEASVMLNKALALYPNKLRLRLLALEVAEIKGDFKMIDSNLAYFKKVDFEKSRFYSAKYYEYLGLSLVKKNKHELAVKSLTKSLKLFDSYKLRRRLAQVEMGNDTAIDTLISNSRVRDLIRRSDNFLREKNLQKAFETALKATALSSDSMDVKINMSRVQLARGYFEEAIRTLEELYNTNKEDDDVIFTLLDVYNRSFKLTESKRLLSVIANTDLRENYLYAEKSADFYIARGNAVSAANWLNRAINKNPISDENKFKLAKIFLKENKLTLSKKLLSQCIDLDPSNVEYRRAYARMIYEVDGVQASIGYLYSVLEIFPDNTKILGEIALSYYKSGQLKRYNDINNKINSLPSKDADFYIAIYELSKIEDNLENVIASLLKIKEISPGLLEYRVELGRYYIADKKYKEALKEFNEVGERLINYPRLQFYKSQLYMLVGNIDEALSLVEKEVVDNPELIEGHILKGQILLKKKDYNNAEIVFKVAQRLNSKNIDVIKGLAYISFIKNQHELALDLYLKAIKIDGSVAELHMLIGDVYRKIGQSRMAIESYKLYLELDPNSRYKSIIESYIRKMK